jgi:AraC-like DNA-binding protein
MTGPKRERSIRALESGVSLPFLQVPGIRLYTFLPPYSQKPLLLEDPFSSRGSGQVLLARPAYFTDASAVRCFVSALQRHAPETTLALWLDMVDRQSVATMAVAASELSVRACVTDAVIDPLQLRSLCSDRAHAPHDIEYRLNLLGHPVGATMRQFIATALEPSCKTVHDIAKRIFVSYDALRRSTRKSGLRSPRAILQVLRLVGVVFDLQSNPAQRTEELANRWGYYDAAAMRRRFNRIFGVPPSTARGWIGWEGLAARGVAWATPTRR